MTYTDPVDADPQSGAGTAPVVTFTANPSMDKTLLLGGPLARGEVQRVASATEQAAGKGVNVARVVAESGVGCTAVLPFGDDAYLAALNAARPGLMAVSAPAIRHRPRTNTTVTEPDGVTTKLNEPGPTLDASDLEAASAQLVAAAAGAKWVALSGSLPPGAPDSWYADLVVALKASGCKIAVDTSDAALDAVIAGLPASSFDLIKPNSDELAQLTGGDAAAFEADAARGEVAAIVAAAAQLRDRGITNVLVTLGGSGAVLVNAEGAWHATAPKIAVRSTVGAGDSSVAGFILADVAGKPAEECLASAVRYGSAAASLPGTTLPTPSDLPAGDVVITRLDS
ncbi:MAG: 1-phosphofructokinase family hexose kinase [Propioniciclava sp.]|uniref:1-phosphofructokinase family hexose kinase n=1 Tax=Propioniciclava sp. TaxID=2038686 RepID=UPI0039E3203D